MAAHQAQGLPPHGVPGYVLGTGNASEQDLVAVENVLSEDSSSQLPRSLTYKELRTTTSQLAAGLRKIGLRVGDRVLLAGPNCLYYSSIILATMGAGGCFVSAPSDFETNEFQHCIATALPKVIIAHPSVLAKLPATLGDHELLFVLDDSDEGAKWPRNDALGTWRHWTRLLDCDIDTTATWLEYSPVQAAETTALICMTSGSTGQRKAAQHSHASLVSLIQIQMRALTTTRPFSRQLTTVGTLAAGHIGLTVEYLMALKARQRFLVTQARDPATIAAIIHRYQVDISFLRPLLLDYINPDVSHVNLQSLCIAYTGGISVPTATMAAALGRLSDQALVVSFFGGTETGLVAVKDERQGLPQNGEGLYLGRLISNVKARLESLVPSTPWKPGQPGILHIHSPANFIGYWQNAEATADTIGPDGYVNTGDIVTMTEGGHLWFVGRNKDVIKKGGSQVIPADIEAVIMQEFPTQVQEVCVVGKPHPVFGEVPIAFILLSSPNKGFAINRVHEVVARKLGPLNELVGGVRIVTSLPRLDQVGKLDKMKLKEMAKLPA